MKWWKVLTIVFIIIIIGYGGYNWSKNKKNISNLSSSDLKFDRAAANDDIFNDSSGPFYHKVYKTSSSDGLNFNQNSEMIIDKASVPDAVKTSNGKVFVYAVDGAGRSISGAMVAISNDNGMTWQQGSLQIKSDDKEMSIADPQAILQDDGSIRLFYLTATGLPDKVNGQPINHNQGIFMIKSATSQDGINFVEEVGTRYQSINEQITDPDIIKINNKWYMYLSMGQEEIATVSDDGNTFMYLQSIRKDGSVSKTVPIDNNQFRQYFCRDGISSATSSDGLNWTDESGIRISHGSGEIICDPSPVKIDNGWLMFYKVEPTQM